MTVASAHFRSLWDTQNQLLHILFVRLHYMHSVVAAYSYTAVDVPWSVALSVVLCVGRDFESSKNTEPVENRDAVWAEGP